jgi:glycosyltransferase involved in cell wall biosynthesis
MLTRLPSICVIVPALNEARYIGRCLKSLAAVNYPAELLEVIVADNGSKDGTVEIARSFASRINLSVAQLPGVTVSALRNLAASRTTAERLAFLDGDCVAPPSWLEEAVRAGRANGGAVLGASYLVPDDDPWVARVWQRHEQRNGHGPVSYVSSHNLHVSRELFERVGGFNELLESNEDYEFCQRALAAGYAVKTHPPLAVVHLGNPRRLRNFYARERWHGQHVLAVFLQDVRKRQNLRAVLFAVYTLACLAAVAAGLFIALAISDWRIAVMAIVGLLFVPLALSIRGAVATGYWRDVPQLALLFLVYGVARSMCLLNRRAVSERKATKVATA